MSFENLQERLRRIEEALSLPIENSTSPIQSHLQYDSGYEEIGRTERRKLAPVRSLEKSTENHLKKVSCSRCGLKFTDERYLKQHIRVHRKKSALIQRSDRGLKFRNKRRIRSHATVRSGNSVAENGDKPVSTQCSICGLKFKDKIYFEQHMTVHNGKRYKCRKCGEQFSLPFMLNQHMWQCHPKSTVKPDSSLSIGCRFCSFEARTHQGLTKHLNVEHWSEYLSPKCSKCGFEFMSKQELDSHAAIEHSEVKYECVVCTFSALSWPNFLAHIKRHYFENFLKCATCEKKFNSKMALRKHIKNHIESTDARRFLERRMNGTKPVETSSSVEELDCSAFKLDEQSAEQYTSAGDKSALEGNTKSVVKSRRGRRKKNQEDENDNNMFSNEQMTSHKYHSCDICHKKIRRKKNLLNHMERHRMARRLECVICGCKYAEKRDLTSHLNEHLKPFRCGECSYRSASKMQLRWHIFRHHNNSFKPDERVLTCALCNYETTTRYSFVKHMRAHLLPELEQKKNALSDHNYSQLPSTKEKRSSLSTLMNWVGFPKAGSANTKSSRSNGNVEPKSAAGEKPSMVLKCMLCDYKTMGELRFKRHMKTHMVENVRSDADRCRLDDKNRNSSVNGEALPASVSYAESIERTPWSIENIEDIRMDESVLMVKNVEPDVSLNFQFMQFPIQTEEGLVSS